VVVLALFLRVGGSSSSGEIKIITPAESPGAELRKLLFVRLATNAIRLPIPVDNLAMRVSRKAKRIA